MGRDFPNFSLAITGEEWGEFLCRLFDVWREDGDVRRDPAELTNIVDQISVKWRDEVENL